MANQQQRKPTQPTQRRSETGQEQSSTPPATRTAKDAHPPQAAKDMQTNSE